MRRFCTSGLLAAFTAILLVPPSADAACCYFSAKNADILQPAQKVFITWDPAEKVETFTVQPKFEGNALDFGMVIPTPTPAQAGRDAARLLQAPRRLHHPEEARVPAVEAAAACRRNRQRLPAASACATARTATQAIERQAARRRSRCWKRASSARSTTRSSRPSRADDLFEWLKENKYSYAGDEATLDFYVQKKWLFTVMKIDTMQMKKNKDGTFAGEVTPTRFQFASATSSSTRSRSRRSR